MLPGNTSFLTHSRQACVVEVTRTPGTHHGKTLKPYNNIHFAAAYRYTRTVGTSYTREYISLVQTRLHTLLVSPYTQYGAPIHGNVAGVHAGIRDR